MRPKAICDLIQKKDIDLFTEISEGLRLCHENAQRTMADVAVNAELKRYRAAAILQGVANEEAAKVLILIDAVRCSRKPEERLSRQFRYFNEHLAKGIYASVCEIRPHSFADVRQWVERERKEFYLDGPTGTDWVYSNQITTHREQAMYVDWVFAEGNYWWHDPGRYDSDMLVGMGVIPSSVLRLCKALRDAGLFAASALAVIADNWRPVEIGDEMSIRDLRDLNAATLEALDQKQLLLTANDETLGVIVNEWIFPLYPLSLKLEPNRSAVEAERGSIVDY